MSLIIISMMTIVALSVVYADNGGCPCNSHPIKDIENTKGDVQPLGECMRYHIEYRCTPKQWTWEVLDCVVITSDWGMTVRAHCRGTWTQQCDKYGVWYDNCTHRKLYEDYLGRVTRTGTKSYWHESWDCSCP